MIEIEITNGTQVITVLPRNIEIPDVRNMSENLQHEEQICKAAVPFDREIAAFLTQEQNVQAVVRDGSTMLFTGFVNGDIGWTDSGFPEPAQDMNIEIHDGTNLLNIKSESETAVIGEHLSYVVQKICTDCGITYGAVFSNDPVVNAVVFQEGSVYLDILTNLLFQYGYSWYFDAAGYLCVFPLVLDSTEPENLDDTDFLTGLEISPAKRTYGSVKVSYSTLVKKQNEQVYWEGAGFGNDGSALPIVLQPGQYYPYESDPVQEAREGKVIQKFDSGFAESYRNYSGEQKFRRSSGTTLVYTENHHVVQDWDSGITLNRTDFGARTAAVRLLNTGSAEASLMQLAIKADAYYRSSENYVALGTGKEYSYDAEYLYSKEAAERLAEMLVRLYTGQGMRFSGTLERGIVPGTVYGIDTGESGLTTYAIAVSCSYNPETLKYSAVFLSVSSIQVTPQMFRRTKSKSPFPGADYNIAVINTEIANIKDGGVEIEAPGCVTGLYASAGENDIQITWNPPPADGLKNSIKRYTVEISKDSGTNWQSCGTSSIPSFDYIFARSTDGYPTSAALATWRFRVRAENIYSKTSIWVTTAVDRSSYLSWQPPTPMNVKATAYKDSIQITWTCDTSQTYGKNLYCIRRNGTVIKSEISENSYTYYFNRNSGEYPEKTDFDTASWTFTVGVSNESGNSAVSTSAVYDKTNYLSWIPAVPRIGATTSGRTVIVDIQQDDSYWDWNRYELQVSGDGTHWYAANNSAAYDPYVDEDSWKLGNEGGDTDLYSRQFSMEMPLEGQSSNSPVNTIYRFRIRAVVHTNQDVTSSFSDVITALARASGVRDIVNSAITTEKLANNAVSSEKIAAGAITAEKISAVAINRINSFTGSDTAVGDESVSGWNLASGSSIQIDTVTGVKCLRITRYWPEKTISDSFEVKPDEILKFSCTIDHPGGPRARIGVWHKELPFMRSSYNFNTGKWGAWEEVDLGELDFTTLRGVRRTFCSYICGSEVSIENIPSPEKNSSDMQIFAFRCLAKSEVQDDDEQDFNKCSIQFWNEVTEDPMVPAYLITPLLVSVSHRGTVSAEDVKAESLAAISANLGDVATGSIASATDNSGNPSPNDSLVYINGHQGSEEFYIGNVSKQTASETNTNHEFMHLHKVGNVFKFILKITNFIVTASQSVIKGILRVKNSISDTDENAFMTVNPSAEPDHGTAGQTVAVNGTVAATNFVGYLNGNADTASYANVAGNAEAASRLTAAGKEALLDAIYPVGSMFWTSKSPADGGNPNSFFPGTWVRIKDAFIYAAGDNDTVDDDPENDTPHGSNTHLITNDELPRHEHPLSGSTDYNGGWWMGQRGVSGANVEDRIMFPGSDNTYSDTGLYGNQSANRVSNASSSTTTRRFGVTSHNHNLLGVADYNVSRHNAYDQRPNHYMKYCWERTE